MGLVEEQTTLDSNPEADSDKRGEEMNLEDIRANLDAKFVQMEADSDKIKKNQNITLQEVRSFLDTWDGIRSDVFLAMTKVQRKYRDAKAEYDDNMRQSMRSGSRSQRETAHFNERQASYETLNLATYKTLRQWEHAKEEIEHFMEYLKRKEQWLEAIRFERLAEDKKETYITSREYLIKD